MAGEDQGPPLSPEDEAAAQSLIDELMEAGFTYDGAGRLTGLAGVGDQGGAGDGGDAGDGGGGEPGDGGAPPEGSGADDGTGAGGDTGGTGTGTGTGGDAGDGGAGDGGQGGTGGVGADGGDHNRAPAQSPTDLEFFALNPTEKAGLLQIRQLLMAHPEMAGRFNDMVAELRTGKKPEGAAGGGAGAGDQTPQLPEFIDPDDPSQVGIWKQVSELQAKHEEAERRGAQASEQARQHQIQTDIAAAVDRFSAAHPELTADDVAKVRLLTQENIHVGGVMQQFSGDPVAGIARALEMGSTIDPTIRDKVLGAAMSKDDADRKDRDRKRQLGALGGSSGAPQRAPAAPKRPGSWNEVAQQLAKELEAIGGSS